jgi:precorrin-6B C5,15-methyltransferase / cobalt-precorrin-6B C5,C15-methyltransferase
MTGIRKEDLTLAITPINVVGMGLDGLGGLSEKVQEIIAQATLLVGSDRHLSYFPEYTGRRIILGDVRVALRQVRTVLEQMQIESSSYAASCNSPEPVAIAATAAQAIVILAPGDPLFFGLGRLLLTEISPEQVTFHPHLTPVQLAFNRLKLPWQDAQILSIYERSLEQIKIAFQAGASKIAVLTESQEAPKAIAQLYLALDLPYTYQIWVCENLGDDQEKIQAFNLNEEGINSLANVEISPSNVVILLRSLAIDQPLQKNTLPVLGIEDQEFVSFNNDAPFLGENRPDLMTKKEVRILVLGELALQPGQIVWDVGAGNGVVSIEIARLCPTSQVYALEKSAMGTSLIEQNIKRLQVQNVISIHGDAPDMLRHLPSPDRIFVGGYEGNGEGNLETILEACSCRLSPGGIVVLAIATVEHIHQSLAWYQRQKWQVKMLQVQLSKSITISNSTYFTPFNPVTIITANL